MENILIWNDILETIKENVTPISFETWFKPLKLRKIDDELKIAYLEISSDDKRNDFIINTIKNRK